MSKDELKRISGEAVQEYIFSHSHEDEKKLLLQTRQILEVPTSLIAQQLAIRKKAETKLPLFFKTKGIIYPPSINWEQCSSEATGNFKAAMISREVGNRKFNAADLTGGFGIDSLYLSKRAESLDFIEPDSGLLNIAQHNHHQLGCVNIHYHPTPAKAFLDHVNTKYNVIYIDPSRRDLNSKKVFRLCDCQPDINDLFPQILTLAEFVLIKTSPLFDIKQGLNELASVKKVIVISVRDECKELLFLMQEGFSGVPIIETYNLDKFGEVKQFFSFTFDEEQNTESHFEEPQTYLYEPNASIMKAGAFCLIGEKFELRKIQANTHFYTSDLLKEHFPGRIFKIDQLQFDAKNFPGKKANVVTRNYPLSAEEIKKKLKLVDGGEQYIIGFASVKKKYLVLATRLV